MAAKANTHGCGDARDHDRLASVRSTTKKCLVFMTDGV
jgi:hypothetical protein